MANHPNKSFLSLKKPMKIMHSSPLKLFNQSILTVNSWRVAKLSSSGSDAFFYKSNKATYGYEFTSSNILEPKNIPSFNFKSLY